MVTQKKNLATWGTVGILLVLGLFIGAVVWGATRREKLRFNNYTDPIFPDSGVYVTQYWPRTAGQLGENIFSGFPQYPTAY